jgi:hypothetical protein
LEELFRFVALRPPQKQVSPLILELPFTSTSSFLVGLRNLIHLDSPIEDIIRLSRERLDSIQADNPAAQLPFHDELVSFNNSLRHELFVSFPRVSQLIQNSFGHPPPELNANTEFINLRNNLVEIIVALEIVPESKPGLLADIANFYRLTYIINRVGQNDQSIRGRKIRAILRSILQIPEMLRVKSSSKSGDGEEPIVPIENGREEETLYLKG